MSIMVIEDPPQVEEYAAIFLTELRSVVFGYTTDHIDYILRTGIAHVSRARNAFQWGTTTGVYELARTGPTERSKIGAIVDMVPLAKVHTLLLVSAEAKAAWEKAKWNQ